MNITDMHVYPTRESLPLDWQDSYIDADPLPLFASEFLHSFMPLVLPIPLDEYLDLREQEAFAALDARDYARWAFRHERPYRMNALIYAAHNQPPQTDRERVAFWQAAADAWVDAEHNETDPIWRELLDAPVPLRQAMTRPKDRRWLAAQDTITVFRGVQAMTDRQAVKEACAGWSWTTDRDTAVWFSRRFLRKPVSAFVAQAKISRKDVVAYLTGRGESEILLPPTVAKQTPIKVERLT